MFAWQGRASAGARLNLAGSSTEIENVDRDLAIAQALRYAEELRTLHASERTQRRAAEEALAQLADSYRTTVRALASLPGPAALLEGELESS